eukprot:350467-Chlamydomonas_euryale.AAC.4
MERMHKSPRAHVPEPCSPNRARQKETSAFERRCSGNLTGMRYVPSAPAGLPRTDRQPGGRWGRVNSVGVPAEPHPSCGCAATAYELEQRPQERRDTKGNHAAPPPWTNLSWSGLGHVNHSCDAYVQRPNRQPAKTLYKINLEVACTCAGREDDALHTTWPCARQHTGKVHKAVQCLGTAPRFGVEV